MKLPTNRAPNHLIRSNTDISNYISGWILTVLLLKILVPCCCIAFKSFFRWSLPFPNRNSLKGAWPLESLSRLFQLCLPFRSFVEVLTLLDPESPHILWISNVKKKNRGHWSYPLLPFSTPFLDVLYRTRVPDICQFWGTAILFRPVNVKGAPKSA